MTLIFEALCTFINIIVLVKVVHLSCIESCKKLSDINFLLYFSASRESQSGSSKQKKKTKSQQYKGHKKSGSPHGVCIRFLIVNQLGSWYPCTEMGSLVRADNSAFCIMLKGAVCHKRQTF